MNNPFDPSHIQEEKAEREARRLKLRSNLLIVLFCAVLAAFFAVLYQAQIVDGDSYRSNSVVRNVQPEQVSSVRGEILDRYGRMLVTNEVSYNVELDTTAMGKDRNAILERLLDICREEGVEWTDSLPISKTAPWVFTTATPYAYRQENEEGEMEEVPTTLGRLAGPDYYKWLDPDDPEKANPTAAQLLTSMCHTFGLIDAKKGEVPDQLDRDLAGVLYELYLRSNSLNNNTYIFARRVDIVFISRVKENDLDGVRIKTATTRKYGTGYAAHVLGYTGTISPEEWERYRELGYPMNATVGKDGVELAFEEHLHGASGTRLIEKDQDGNVVSQQWRTEPQPGENVVLTLDMALQATTEDLLAQYAASQEESGPMAAAVVDMTGGVLALASYPTYDLSTFRENFSALSADEDEPLLNRATHGLYAPGSTFKMLTAVAALSEGVITTTDRVECTGIYKYYNYPDWPHCWIYDSVRGSHGWDNVTKAITDSCNVFFYDVGRRTGIENLQKYAAKFGLGEYTGIEIPEYKGEVAGPETSARYGQTWVEGATMSVAIGQENNQFTPLQMANYTAALANGGTHYAAHLLKSVKSNDYAETIETYQPKVLDQIDIDPENLAAIHKGMIDLTTTGSLRSYFKDLDFTVAAKTGSVQVAGQDTSNATFICFAPADDPQVALAIVAQKGGSGSGLAGMAAEILDYYFNAQNSFTTATEENTLLR